MSGDVVGAASFIGKKNELLLYKTSGFSMLPTIKGGDTVVVSADYTLSPFDIVAFLRNDGMVVIHRYIKSANGKYLIKGDNTFYDEWVSAEQIIGVVICRIKKGSAIDDFTKPSAKFFAKIHNFYPIKRLSNLFYRGINSLKKK